MFFIIHDDLDALSIIGTEGMLAFTSQGHTSLRCTIFTINASVGIAIHYGLGTRTRFLLRRCVLASGGDAFATIAASFRTGNLAVFSHIARIATIAAWFIAESSSRTTGRGGRR